MKKENDDFDTLIITIFAIGIVSIVLMNAIFFFVTIIS
jgi:hypothetical protein